MSPKGTRETLGSDFTISRASHAYSISISTTHHKNPLVLTIIPHFSSLLIPVINPCLSLRCVGCRASYPSSVVPLASARRHPCPLPLSMLLRVAIRNHRPHPPLFLYIAPLFVLLLLPRLTVSFTQAVSLNLLNLQSTTMSLPLLCKPFNPSNILLLRRTTASFELFSTNSGSSSTPLNNSRPKNPPLLSSLPAFQPPSEVRGLCVCCVGVLCTCVVPIFENDMDAELRRIT